MSEHTPKSCQRSGRPGPGESTIASKSQRDSALQETDVVVDHDRLLAGHGREQVKDVVGVGVVVVDQQRAHRSRPPGPSPRALRSSSVCTTRSTRFAALALQVPEREVLEVVRERPDVEPLDGQTQVAAVELRLDHREAVVGVLGRPAAGRGAAPLRRARARTRSQPRLSSSRQQPLGVEVDVAASRGGAGSTRARSAPRRVRASGWLRRTSCTLGSLSICASIQSISSSISSAPALEVDRALLRRDHPVEDVCGWDATPPFRPRASARPPACGCRATCETHSEPHDLQRGHALHFRGRQRSRPARACAGWGGRRRARAAAPRAPRRPVA